MSFQNTFEVQVPDCSPEELVQKVWGLADGQPRESHLVGPGQGVLGDIGWFYGFNTQELARITVLDAQEKGDLRGKTLLCALRNVALSEVEKATELFREHGFFPSAQGFMAAVLQSSCRDHASLPLPTGKGQSVIWYVRFSPGSSVQEEPDSRSFNTFSLEEAVSCSDRDSVLSVLGFKIKE